MYKLIKIKFYIFYLIIFIILYIFGHNIFLKVIYPVKYENIVSKVSEKYKIDKNLIYSIIKVESNFNPDAKSHAGAIGLMQITPDTFEWLKLYSHEKNLDLNNLKDPNININYGVLFLSILKKKYTEDDLVLSAYNAGISCLDRWLKDENLYKNNKLIYIPYEETRNYVKKIKIIKKIYKKLGE